jgi:diacylglycerol kinase family enzyme
MPASASRPPAVLIVNPNAGRLSDQARAEVVSALRSRYRLDVFPTEEPGSGMKIAGDAAASGAELVIAFGGDGHVNEVVNGLAETSTALGIIPGGTMNVFARALGIPLNPRDAIEHLDVSRAGRTVPLGKMDDRYFTFAAGCGFDAEAAQRVERYVPVKRRFGELFFYWSAVRVLAGSYRHRNPSMTLSGVFGEVAVSMVIASNAGPYAYFGPLPVQVAPEVRLEMGLDVFALKTMRVEALPIYMWRVLVSHDIVHHNDSFYRTDLDCFELSAPESFARHVDGEPVAPSTAARFSSIPRALQVRA